MRGEVSSEADAVSRAPLQSEVVSARALGLKVTNYSDCEEGGGGGVVGKVVSGRRSRGRDGGSEVLVLGVLSRVQFYPVFLDC